MLIALVLAGCADRLPDTPIARGGETAPLAAGRAESQSTRLARMGDDALRAGDPATAVGLYHRAVSLDDRNLAATQRLGEALLKVGRHSDAIDAFRRVLRSSSTDPDAARGFARGMLGVGRPDAAVAQAEQALSAHPSDTRLANVVAVAYDLLGRHQDAERLYRQGLKHSPDNVMLRNNLGLSLAIAGRPDEGIALLEPVALGPQSTRRARLNLAAAYALKGNLVAAQRTLQLDLDEANVRSNLAFFTTLRGLGNSAKVAQALLQETPSASYNPEVLSTRPVSNPAELEAAPAQGPAQPPSRRVTAEPVRKAAAADVLTVPLAATPTTALAPAVQTKPVTHHSPIGTVTAQAAAHAPLEASSLASGVDTQDRDLSPNVLPALPALPSTRAVLPVELPSRLEPVIEAKPLPVLQAPASHPQLAEQTSPAAQASTIDGVKPEKQGPIPLFPAKIVNPDPVTASGSTSNSLPELIAGSVVAGDWVIDLGTTANTAEAAERWRSLQRAHPAELGSAGRLASAGQGRQSLLVGPFVDRLTAEKICRALAVAQPGCKITRL